MLGETRVNSKRSKTIVALMEEAQCTMGIRSAAALQSLLQVHQVISGQDEKEYDDNMKMFKKPLPTFLQIVISASV